MGIVFQVALDNVLAAQQPASIAHRLAAFGTSISMMPPGASLRFISNSGGRCECAKCSKVWQQLMASK